MQRKNFLGRGNDPFTCENCGAEVLPLEVGFRNHCPDCLWSLHVDVVPGDRRNACRGLMEPIAIEGSQGAGWYIVHRCLRCGATCRNGCAEKDARQPDRHDAIVALMAQAPAPRRRDAARRRRD